MVDDFELVKREYAIKKWVQEYEERTGDKFKLLPEECIQFDSEKGFTSYVFDVRRMQLFVPKICGDGLYWTRFLRQLIIESRRNGMFIRRWIWNTTQNHKALSRLYKKHLPDLVTFHLRTDIWKDEPVHRMATYFRNEVQQWQA